MKDKDEVRVTLRLPSSLYDELLVKATGSQRSMNGEIIALLSAILLEGQDASEAALLEEWSSLRTRIAIAENDTANMRQRMAWLDEQIARLQDKRP
ncbi:Arc family DNA-binding protein [Sphingobium sp. AR-3-1]|uniref:Arc family DNA-binding protein n=1 Tax=Sphingobium psychrophilum TaxID=2728834 RepID=A0A7X9WWR1_9SPHN|nr:Arc family DNA-binding protein [Sphingobium psychrophilum]NML11298.1 Arc family DNA-binding protein [Sphingobium psychrophilum]